MTIWIDEMIIAASFILYISPGAATTLAVIFTRPPRIGDFGVLVYGGFEKMRALIWNYLSAVTVSFSGIAGYYLSSLVEGATVLLLPFAAGNFVYIAASDLIPEIKHGEDIRRNLVHFFTFMIGILLMFLIKLLTE